ncbi:MAG: helix-turn-helix domain-containing protein [Gemmatimonadetes bacterium]|nr:helix-turn-helix domain-containing protein [Gemmatimonadota bacterium]
MARPAHRAPGPRHPRRARRERGVAGQPHHRVAGPAWAPPRRARGPATALAPPGARAARGLRLPRERGPARAGGGRAPRPPGAGVPAHCGLPVTERARALRLAHAERLLRTTAAPLAEVAYRAGYADQSHLTRAVRGAFGATPLALRRGTLPPFKTRRAPAP